MNKIPVDLYLKLNQNFIKEENGNLFFLKQKLLEMIKPKVII